MQATKKDFISTTNLMVTQQIFHWTKGDGLQDFHRPARGAFSHGVDHGDGGKMPEDDHERSASKFVKGLACKSLHLLFFGFVK